MQQPSTLFLPDQVTKWVVKSVDPLATMQSIHQLRGATSSTLYRISLLTDQVKKTFVLRQFSNKKWLNEEPDIALHEANSLLYAAQNGLHTPQLIAYDGTGNDCGLPSVLMSYLEGEVILKPHNMGKWLNELAKTLVQIHAVNAGSFKWNYSAYTDVSTFEIPSWSNSPELWQIIINRIKQPPPETKRCFIHRDYHPTNILWNMDKVCGIVDWVNACIGPSGIDVGHCRINLAMLFDVTTADNFLLAYKKLAGSSFNYDPYWDVISLIDILEGPPKVYQGWTDLGIEGLTDQLMKERVDQYLASLVKLLSS